MTMIIISNKNNLGETITTHIMNNIEIIEFLQEEKDSKIISIKILGNIKMILFMTTILNKIINKGIFIKGVLKSITSIIIIILVTPIIQLLITITLIEIISLIEILMEINPD